MTELCYEYLSVQCIWLDALILSHMCFRVNPLYICLTVTKFLLWNRCKVWSLSECNKTWTNNQFVCKQTLNDLAKLAKWLSCVVCSYLYDAFDCMFLSCHLCISEWIHTIYLPECQIRHKIWSLSDCNKTETHNHLLRKRTLNHLAKLAKWLSCVVSTYLYGTFDSIFFLCHIHVLEWILWFMVAWMSRNSLLETGPKSEVYVTQRDSNLQPLGWVVIYERNSCGFCEFKSCWSHLNFRFHTCLKQEVPCQSSKYSLWIHLEIRMLYDNNIQSKALYR